MDKRCVLGRTTPSVSARLNMQAALVPLRSSRPGTRQVGAQRGTAQRLPAVKVSDREPKTSVREQEQQSATSEAQDSNGAAGEGLDLNLINSLEEEVNEAGGSSNDQQLSPLALLVPVAGILALLGGGYLLKDQLKDFLDFFTDAVDDWGVWGWVAYAVTYTALEVLAVPAIPLTMTAGVVFGPLPGTAVVAISSTLAAGIAFLIARYAMRDKILHFAKGNRRFAAIDKAIGKDGFKFVTLLRLSPLFPFAASNYLYGLTAVGFWPYMAGSLLGSLPGTYAYVSAGHVGKAVLRGGEGSLSVETWQVALGMGATLLALGLIGQVAKQALSEAQEEDK